MRRSLLVVSTLVVLGSLVLLPAALAQAPSATASATATAEIVTNLQIANTSPLNFGALVVGPAGGTATVSPAGARSLTGSVVGMAVPPWTAAGFTVTGEPNATYTIALPAVIPLFGPGAPMAVDTFVSSLGASGQIEAGGTQAFTVGATLHVGALQTPGTYNGVFDVTVAYN